MADVRALLAAEKSSRRITHHHASYTKSGLLTCTACDLTIRSESLWEGHLKSANHRKNAARIAAGQINREYHVAANTATQPAAASKTLKRKIEDVEEHDAQQEERNYENDGRKKAKPRATPAAASERNGLPSPGQSVTTTMRTERPDKEKHVRFSAEEENGNVIGTTPALSATELDEPESNASPAQPSPLETLPQPTTSVGVGNDADATADIDEDEWAAFESDITSLETQQGQQVTPNLNQASSAVITAAPVSAEQIRAQEAQVEAQRKKLRDTEIEDEQEDESRRIEDEFEVMEEMEERVRRLKEKRESLRVPLANAILGASGHNLDNDQDSNEPGQNDQVPTMSKTTKQNLGAVDADAGPEHEVQNGDDDDDDDDDENEIDRWYS